MLGHTVFAVMLQACIAVLLRNWAAGAAVASAWAISREITQAEYRWIEQYGHGLRANMTWWGGLDARVWQHLDPLLDWILPCAVTISLATLVSKTKRRLA